MNYPVRGRSKVITIMIHVLIWLALLLVPLLFIENPEGIRKYIVFGGSHLLFMAGYFYLNFLWLIPKYLLKRKLVPYISSLLIALVLISIMNFVYDREMHTLFFPEGHHHPGSRAIYGPLFSALLALGLSTSLRITNEWLRNEKQKKEMENEKLTSELAFLKSQVNPHFLFNILNNICSLARKKSDETENALIKLSQIMRYMLYESKDEKVGLDREIEYLQNYIELQRLRISDRVTIRFTVTGSSQFHQIEPMLLIPFVENAFKHGVSYLDNSIIDIILTVEEPEMTFLVENTIAAVHNEKLLEESGIGLRNVSRRLELLYPGKHILKIKDDGKIYKAFLKILF